MHSINFICQKGHMGEVFGVKRRRGRIVLTPLFFFFFLSIVLTHLNILLSIITKHVH